MSAAESPTLADILAIQELRYIIAATPEVVIPLAHVCKSFNKYTYECRELVEGGVKYVDSNGIYTFIKGVMDISCNHLFEQNAFTLSGGKLFPIPDGVVIAMYRAYHGNVYLLRQTHLPPSKFLTTGLYNGIRPMLTQVGKQVDTPIIRKVMNNDTLVATFIPQTHAASFIKFTTGEKIGEGDHLIAYYGRLIKTTCTYERLGELWPDVCNYTHGVTVLPGV